LGNEIGKLKLEIGMEEWKGEMGEMLEIREIGGIREISCFKL